VLRGRPGTQCSCLESCLLLLLLPLLLLLE
jgi:hypothetical protein